jgi:hypothetical protein
MPSMRKSLINLMRFLLSSPRWPSQEYHRPMKLRTCATTTMKKSRISKIKTVMESSKYAQCVKIWPLVWKFGFHLIFVWNMLNVWKYGHLCENLTFIEYLCEICSMCENMAICMQIWLSLDICVKYAQCVKIWLFLMDTILNLTIVQFLMKKKGDML